MQQFLASRRYLVISTADGAGPPPGALPVRRGLGGRDRSVAVPGGAWRVIDDIDNDSRRYTLPQMVGDPDKDAAMLADNSPLLRAREIKASLLLAFGETDRRVPLEHGERLRAALAKAGRTPEWVTYPNEAHSWRQVATQVDFARRMEKFLGQHLKGQAK